MESPSKRCGLDKLSIDNHDKLTDPKKVKERTEGGREYTFEENKCQFFVTYKKNRFRGWEASVNKIKCNGETLKMYILGYVADVESGDDDESDDESDDEVTSKLGIYVDTVQMYEAKGKKLCTRSVAYMIKVLVIESKAQKIYPYLGTVHVTSENPCAAVNCYIKAFKLNGYDEDDSEVDEFPYHMQQDSDSDEWKADFTFRKFSNYKLYTLQRLKEAAEEEEEKEEEEADDRQHKKPRLKFKARLRF